MKKVVSDLLNEYKVLRKWEKRALIWYAISITIIVVEYLINHQLDSHVYFHPYISIMVNIFFIVDIFFIPMIFIVKEIIKGTENNIIKILHVFFSTIGLGILTIILFLIFTLSNKSVISSNTVNIIQKNDKIYIEEKIWLESYNHVNVYQIENIIFIKSIGNI